MISSCRADLWPPLGRTHVRQRAVIWPSAGSLSWPPSLNAVYEADFLGFSYGFRPGRSPHDALDALTAGIYRKKVSWVLDADIRDFFGSLDRDWLMRFLRHRIADERVLRLISKWLAAGVVEDGKLSETEQGSPQGASLSPLLASVYLHVRHEC